jgi:hypothetical protein
MSLECIRCVALLVDAADIWPGVHMFFCFILPIWVFFSGELAINEPERV